MRYPLMQRALTRILILALALLTTACSTGTRLAYNNLDRLARWEVGQYIDFSDAQRAAFDQEFAPVWDWHRHSQLPLYAADLRQLAAELAQGGPDRAGIDRFGDRINLHANTLADRLLPGAARLLATLDDAQVAKLLDRQRKQIEKRFKKHAGETPEARRQRALDDGREALEPWIGRLTEAQTARLQRGVDEAFARGDLDAAHARSESLADLGQFAEVLAQRRQPGFEAKLKTLEDPANAAEQAQAEAVQARTRSFFADLVATLEPAQRERLRKRLLDYADDCDALAAHP